VPRFHRAETVDMLILRYPLASRGRGTAPPLTTQPRREIRPVTWQGSHHA